jgi:acyl carrier protein
MTATREEVFELVRSYLAEELGLDASRIEGPSRLKEDLEADSLHLLELVVDLEDRYGIRIPDDQAEQVETVDQAVDLVLAHAPAQTSP